MASSRDSQNKLIRNVHLDKRTKSAHNNIILNIINDCLFKLICKFFKSI